MGESLKGLPPNWVKAQKEWAKETPVERGGVLFMGTSVLAKWNVAESFPKLRCLNRAVSGSLSIDWMYKYGPIRDYINPEAIVWYGGDNDIAKGLGFEYTFRLLKEMGYSSARLFVLGVKPCPQRWEFRDQQQVLNNKMAMLCQMMPRATFINIWPLFLKHYEDEGGITSAPDHSLVVEDGLHPNRKGYALMKMALDPYLSHLVRE